MIGGGIVEVDRGRGWPCFRFLLFSVELDGSMRHGWERIIPDCREA